MIIKNNYPKDNFKFFSKIFNSNFFFKIYFLSTILFLLVITIAFFNLGIWEKNKNEFLQRIYSNGISNYKYLPQIAYHSIRKNFYSYKNINLNINQKNKIILEKNRMDLIENLKNITHKEYGTKIDFADAEATITVNNKILKTDIRLKGDRPIHYEDIKNSSYRLDISRDEALFGVKKFSIQKPIIRNYLYEWVFHELMSEGGLIKPKYEFLYFTLNGKKKGLYVLEEGFGKELLERNSRRNGPIFSLNEEFEGYNIDKGAKGEISNLKFEIYNKRFWNQKDNIDVARYATQKIKGFVKKDIQLTEIFDVKKWAWYLAVVDLTYTYHGILPKSVKFYYNPINGKFEPIPFDGHRMVPSYSKFLPTFDHSTVLDIATRTNNARLELWLNRFFYLKNGELNQEFYSEYIEAIKKITSKNFLNNFFDKRSREMKKITSAIYADSFWYDYMPARPGIGIYHYDRKDIFFRASTLLEIIKPQKDAIFIEENENNLVVHNKWIYNIGLNLSELSCESKNNEATNTTNIPINKQLKYKKQIISKEKFLIKNQNCNFLLFTNKENNFRFYKKVDKMNGEYKLKNIKKENYKKYFSPKDKKLFLKDTITIIEENLLIPKNYQVIIKPNDQIILKNNAFIFSKSAWKIGGDGKEVVIRGEENNFGGGILITDTKETSLIKNVKFSYLAGIKNSNLQDISTTKNIQYNFNNEFIILGAINFHEADVELENVLFEKVSSEDVINIFRSNFKINNFKSFENASDSIDIDFSRGEINKVEFRNIGNDAIDLSGSKVSIQNILFENIGDKLISVGENSVANISDITAKKSFVGIASKDGSIVNANKIKMYDVKIPFSAYQKKSAYGYGEMNLGQFFLEKNYVKWITDERSTINVDGNNVGVKIKKIIPIIYNKDFEMLKKTYNLKS